MGEPNKLVAFPNKLKSTSLHSLSFTPSHPHCGLQQQSSVSRQRFCQSSAPGQPRSSIHHLHRAAKLTSLFMACIVKPSVSCLNCNGNLPLTSGATHGLCRSCGRSSSSRPSPHGPTPGKPTQPSTTQLSPPFSRS